MLIEDISFAETYHKLISKLQENPTNISCRGLEIIYEITDVRLQFPVKTISIYSNVASRCVPIRFILAEFLWILSGSNKLFDIGRFNSRMRQFSDDGVTLYGAYGARLIPQMDACIDKLITDKHTRQAYIPIYTDKDIHAKSKDIPCNTSLQFMIRDNALNLTVMQRSSDFTTGLSIDAIHWQILLLLVCETLRKNYRYLLPGRITYNIASLHIYSIDDSLITQWKTNIENYDHRIHIRDDYFSMHEKAKKDFMQCDTLLDLMILYNFSFYEMELLQNLNRQFINQKNKPVR